MKLKKVTCLALAATLALGSLTGCGDSTSTKGDSTTTPSGDSGKNDSGSDSKEATKLKIHFHAQNKYTLLDADGKLYPVFKLAGEKTNTEIESAANPVAQNSLEEFQLQAADKFPADIYGGTGLKSSISAYAAQGAFISLNDLIEEHAPNIKKFLDENPDVKKAQTDADGNIYMLNYIPDGEFGRVYFIRTDWLKKLNLETPTTFDELEKVLYAFRNDDPNGNGKKDEVPVFNDKWQEVVRLANLWGARVFGFDSFTERVVIDKDDNMYHAWTAPEFKEALKGLAKWYEDGIIDQEAFTRKLNTARQTLWTKDNVGGMTHEFFASTSAFNYNEELLSAVPDFKVQAFLPVNKNGVGFEEHHRATAKQDGWAISANCKDPVAAIKLMDWFYTEEGRRAINFGVEGLSYEMKDGKPVFKDEVLEQTNVNTYIQQTFGAQLPIGYKQDFAYEEQWLSKEGKEANDLYTANKDTVLSAKLTPILPLTAEEREELESCLTAVNDYQDETIIAFITGKTDIDENWDSYVEKCKALGSEKLVEIYKSGYKRYKEMK